jgi:hypothetical protein
VEAVKCGRSRSYVARDWVLGILAVLSCPSRARMPPDRPRLSRTSDACVDPVATAYGIDRVVPRRSFCLGTAVAAATRGVAAATTG